MTTTISDRGLLLISGLFALLAAIAFLSGCTVQQNTPYVNSNAPVASNSAPEPASVTQSSNVPITLPVIGALLEDETFVSEMRSSLAITDEQIQKLKDSAKNAVLQLSDNGIEDDSRSTRASEEKAKKEIEKVLGKEKAGQLLALSQKQMAGLDADFAQVKPSSVPTDTRIVVNAPGYRMDVFKDGKLEASYKIGIGYPEFPLPTGLRQAKNIIFNPTWTPPDEPWVKGKIEAGKTIAAGSSDNPLGPIKIPIGLPSLIHGGKSPDRLGTFASHGCVGLTNKQIQDFAMRISALSGDAITPQEISEFAKKKTETKDVKFDKPMPVELRYETIVVEDGKLKIFRDVYERGTNTEENLRRVLDAFGVSLDNIPAAERQKIMTGLEQMAVDASGKPVETEDMAKANTKASKTGKVTRNIKGKKELIFSVAGLAGKGYPAPVKLQS